MSKYLKRHFKGLEKTQADLGDLGAGLQTTTISKYPSEASRTKFLVSQCI